MVIAFDRWKLPQSYIHHTQLPTSPNIIIGLDSEVRCELVRSYSHPLHYSTDRIYSKVLDTFQIDDDQDRNYRQYQMIEGLIYFEDWNRDLQLCIPDSFCIEVMSEVHNILTQSAHGGHAKTI